MSKKNDVAYPCKAPILRCSLLDYYGRMTGLLNVHVCSKRESNGLMEK